jgi:HPt (histidine-containing phosphotransfer) domain-containing protein
MSDAPVLDAQVLDDLIEHIGADAVRSIVEIFIDETRDLVTAIGSAATSDIARRAAHSLKSSAGQLGASSLADLAQEVESAAEAGSAALPGLVSGLLDCAARTEAALAARLAG